MPLPCGVFHGAKPDVPRYIRQYSAVCPSAFRAALRSIRRSAGRNRAVFAAKTAQREAETKREPRRKPLRVRKTTACKTCEARAAPSGCCNCKPCVRLGNMTKTRYETKKARLSVTDRRAGKKKENKKTMRKKKAACMCYIISMLPRSPCCGSATYAPLRDAARNTSARRSGWCSHGAGGVRAACRRSSP